MRRTLLESVLNKVALAETCAEEDGVDAQQDPATSAKGDGRHEQTDPEEDFETGDEHHAGVIVFLNELADGVGCGGLGLVWSGACGGCRGSSAGGCCLGR